LAGMVISQPVVRGDLVLVGTDHDTVQALEKATGKIKWTYPREGAAELTIRGGTGIAVGGNRVYAGFADGSAVALAPEDGRLLWEARLGTPGNNTFPDVVAAPVYRDGTVYAASFAEGVSALDAATGQVRWKYAVRGTVAMAQGGDLLYAA